MGGNNDGASSNRAGNDEEDDEDDLLGEPNENQIRILKKRNKELEAQTRELRQKVPQTSRESVVQTSLDLAQDVGEAAATKKCSEDALKLAKKVNDDWAKSTKAEARCKEFLAKAKKCHKCEALGCKDPWSNCAEKNWVSKSATYASTKSWERTKWWYKKAYEHPQGGGVLVHRAGLHTVSTHGGGAKFYVCASWTAVCTAPKDLAQAQCRSARLILGGGRPKIKQMNKLKKKLPEFICEWISAEAMATHEDSSLRIVLPQFG